MVILFLLMEQEKYKKEYSYYYIKKYTKEKSGNNKIGYLRREEEWNGKNKRNMLYPKTHMPETKSPIQQD